MEIATATDFRQNMRSYFDKIMTMSKPLFITRSKGEDIVVMSKREYLGIQETFHLLKSPKNADRLLQSIEKDKAGNGTTRELLD